MIARRSRVQLRDHFGFEWVGNLMKVLKRRKLFPISYTFEFCLFSLQASPQVFQFQGNHLVEVDKFSVSKSFFHKSEYRFVVKCVHCQSLFNKEELK